MTPEEINKAIATHCGWKDVKSGKLYAFELYGTSPDPEIGRTRLPNYCGDLNAMHEAERTLDVNALSKYADELDRVCVPVHVCPLTHWHAVVMTTAAQRAEAFLRAVGKWQSTPETGKGL